MPERWTPDSDAITSFRWHTGSFDEGRQYLALEYPLPPPVDLGDMDPMEMVKSGTKTVLAPFYSVILYDQDKQAGKPQYFILGQAPIGGGTTVRTILEDGANCNLGPGPLPTLDGFLEAIRERQREFNQEPGVWLLSRKPLQ